MQGFSEAFSGLNERLLLLLCLQQTLKVNIKGVAVTGGFVWAGLDLLGFLGAEGIGSGVFNIHLQLYEDLQGILELSITATETQQRMNEQSS